MSNRTLEQISAELREDFESFLASPFRNSWVASSQGEIQVYCRKGIHSVFGGLKATLDVATVEVKREFQKQGLLKIFLDYVLDTTKYEYVYIENAFNEALANYLRQNGWLGTKEESNCFVKKSKHATS